MSATSVSTCTTVRAKARSVTVVANEIANVLLRTVDHYGLKNGSLTSRLDRVLNGFRVWLTAQQLETVLLEVTNRSGRLVRKWELSIDYTEIDQDEDESRLEELEAFLAEDRPDDAARYRIVVTYRSEKHIRVPGWSKTKRADDSHLRARRISGRLVSTKHLRCAAIVFTDHPTSTGDEP